MTAETKIKASLGTRALDELKAFVILTIYLFIPIGAVMTMQTAALQAHNVELAHWGVAIVKAAVLAKFMLLGKAMKIGGHNKSRPLIWPMLQRSLAYLLLLIVLTVVEESVLGLVHGQSIGDVLGEMVGSRLDQSLAGILVLLVVLIPYFAFQVLAEALGEHRLAKMFLVDRNAGS